ncbi:MAG: adenylosuccinate synthase [Chitinispirillaceae bacterium]|nr:adenylosuccinate synthase [Chitinispirillaceae bacterium]
MSNAVIVGTQWGDEGKAKVIDYLTERSDLVIRFQGGANAGHTVIANRRKFIFHLVPSGIMYPDKVCIVGNGVVFDAEQFLKEVDELDAVGISVAERLFVSDVAHLVLPYHKSLDTARESSMGKEKIGTTGRGIGPAYADKVSRTGIRVGDLADADLLTEKIRRGFERHRALTASIYKADFSLSLDEIIDQYAVIRQRMLPYIDDTAFRIFEAYGKGNRLLFEGAQGTFLDIDHGTYPFVTSANTIAGCACSGSGIGPAAIDHVIGIVKTYTTRVGNGPFPTELDNATGEMLRTQGGEFGATTGRSRRCGWFDSVMVRKAVQVNGLTHLALTKLDVLNNFDEICICTHYEIRGKRVDQFPSNPELINEALPVYESLPGWKSDIAQCRSYDELPAQARIYIERLRELCYNIPLLIVSVGPDRTQTIEVTPLT